MNNYGANVADCYWNGIYWPGFKQVITFPQNGRTYATLNRQDLWHKNEIVEVITTGIRPTGILLDDRFSVLEANGTITQNPLFNNTWVQQTVTGFDVNGNPQYSAATQIASAPMGAANPVDSGMAAISSTGVVAVLEENDQANKFHLGGVQTGTNVWAWRAEPAVPTASYEAGLNFGDFDIGDGVNYAANTVIARGRQIINDFHGEFYKQSQAGQFMHHLDNGLFVGQFGSSGLMPNGQRWPFGGNVLAGFAGNNFGIQIVSYNNELYVWTNDENCHGPQRWHLSNLNSINVLYGSGTVGGTITAGTTEAKSIVAAPSFSPVAGTFASTQNLTISSTTAGATIRYTTDGSTPSATNGAIYTSPVAIAVTTTLKAIAYKLEMADSTVTSGVYTINCVAPTFSPVAGTYTTAQSVTISSTTAGASIRYTTDGSTPTSTTGTLYTVPVAISASATLKAIAYKTGMGNSTVTSGAYVINSNCVAPAFSPVAGTYTGTQSVTISTTTSGASIRYTTNGTTPTSTTGTLYTVPVAISASATLKAIAYKTGMGNSTVTSGAYVINCVAPAFSPVAGTYATAQTVTISSTTAGASIRYTTDGTTPTSTTGTLYTVPVAITVNTTLKAIAYKTGMGNSTVTSGAYVINCVAPAFSPVAGTYTSAQSVTISTTTAGASIRYTTDGTTPTSTTGTVYTVPVAITVNTTLKAIAYKTGMGNSTVTSGAYVINGNSIPTTHVSTTEYAEGVEFMAPANSYIAGSWCAIDQANRDKPAFDTYVQGPVSPAAGWSLNFPTGDGRYTIGYGFAAPPVDMYHVSGLGAHPWGVDRTQPRTSLTTNGLITTTLTMAIPAGNKALVHIAWECLSNNTYASAKLIVTDNTNSVTFDSTTVPAFDLPSWYNHTYREETIIQVGSCQSMTISVVSTAPGASYLAGVWVVPSIPTSHVSTTEYAEGVELMVPANSNIAGSWCAIDQANRGNPAFDTYVQGPVSPAAGWSLNFPTGDGRYTIGYGFAAPPVDMYHVSGLGAHPWGVDRTQPRTSLTTNGLISATLTMPIPAGNSAEVHIAWGCLSNNSYASAKLIVTDNTNSVTFDSTTVPAFDLPSWYNHTYREETIMQVGSCQSMTISVVSTTPGASYLAGVWVVPVP